MHYTTRKKITILRRFIFRNYKSFVIKYPGIIGVHIGLKTRKKKQSDRYSIVFHVAKKRNLKNKKKEIPEFFKIKINNKSVTVPTDVVESGNPILSNMTPGNKVFHKKFPSSFGSASIFLTDKTDIYLLTNMHVIGKDHLKNSFKTINLQHDFGDADVFCSIDDNDSIDMACFKSGIVDDFIDAAIAIINPLFHEIIENKIENVQITGSGKVDFSVASTPRKVIIRGASSGIIKNISINSNTAVRAFNYPLGSITLFELLQISPCKTKGGDSGSPIIDAENNKLLGIVLGKDSKNTFTYGIPIDKLLDFFKLKILN